MEPAVIPGWNGTAGTPVGTEHHRGRVDEGVGPRHAPTIQRRLDCGPIYPGRDIGKHAGCILQHISLPVTLVSEQVLGSCKLALPSCSVAARVRYRTRLRPRSWGGGVLQEGVIPPVPDEPGMTPSRQPRVVDSDRYGTGGHSRMEWDRRDSGRYGTPPRSG
jgi:hypothetical protein